eukprot:3011610-Prorocentrum_lima.AAC.1
MVLKDDKVVQIMHRKTGFVADIPSTLQITKEDVQGKIWSLVDNYHVQEAKLSCQSSTLSTIVTIHCLFKEDLAKTSRSSQAILLI